MCEVRGRGSAASSGAYLLRRGCDELSFRDFGVMGLGPGCLQERLSCWSKLSQFRSGFPTYSPMILMTQRAVVTTDPEGRLV